MKARKKKEESESEMELEDEKLEDQEDELVNHPISSLLVIIFYKLINKNKI